MGRTLISTSLFSARAFVPVLKDDALKFFYRHRPVIVKALYQVAADRTQEIGLLLIFHALGHSPYVESLCEGDDALDDGLCLRRFKTVDEKDPVQLEAVYMKVFQQPEGRVDGDEIVQ